MSNPLPPALRPCPCINCTKRYFNKETNRTCHCDCQDYKDWSEENRLWHEQMQKFLQLKQGLDAADIKRQTRNKRI
jgi:hypothetical protein